ncbi:CMP-N-acetylneuraminate-poly-alpha-2,8-sialyltransferase-like [Glandiceps talaboti]
MAPISIARKGVLYFVALLPVCLLVLWYGSISVYRIQYFNHHYSERKRVMSESYGKLYNTKHHTGYKKNPQYLPPDMTFLNKTWKWNERNVIDVKRHLGRFMDARRSLSITKSEVTIADEVNFNFIPGNTSLTVTQDMYSLLPVVSPLRNRYARKCALVGNSGILANSSCGSEIDSADFVIRCNFASINGYERDVGSKLNLLSFNPSILQLKYNLLKNETDKIKFYNDLQNLRRNQQQVLLWIPAFDHRVDLKQSIYPLVHFMNQQRENLTHIQLLLPHSIDRVYDGYWQSRGIQGMRLSTGLVLYTLALELCQHVELYGFYPYATDLQGNKIPYHYDQPKNMTFKPGNMHNFPVEFAYLKRMHENGVSRLRIGQCR